MPPHISLPSATRIIISSGGGNIRWGHSSGTFNDDGSASQTLQHGQTYSCSVQISDQYMDFAYSMVTVIANTQSTAQALADYAPQQSNPYSLMLHVNGQNIATTVTGPNIAQTALSTVRGS